MTAQSPERIEILRDILAAVKKHSIVGGRHSLTGEPMEVMKHLFMQQPLPFLEFRMPEVIVLVMEYIPNEVSALLEKCIAALAPVPISFDTVIEHTEWIRQLRTHLYEKHIRGVRIVMPSESDVASLTSDFIERVAEPMSDVIKHDGQRTESGVTRIRSEFFAYITQNNFDPVAMYSAIQRAYSNILDRFAYLKGTHSPSPARPTFSDVKGKQLLHCTRWLNDFRSEIYTEHVQGKRPAFPPELLQIMTADFVRRVAEPLLAALATGDSEHIQKVTIGTRDEFKRYVKHLLIHNDPVAIFTAVQRTYTNIMNRATSARNS